MLWFKGSVILNDGIRQNTIYPIDKLFENKFDIKYQKDCLETDFCYLEMITSKKTEFKKNKITKKYNYLLIGDIRIDNRNDLIKYNASGFNFDSDEELLLELFHQLREESFQLLSGDFSFGIIDLTSMELFLTRDPLGVKSLYWVKAGNRVCFSSDLFLLEGEFNFSKLNKSYIEEFYYSEGIVDSEITPYMDVFRVPSGHYASIKEGYSFTKSYWDLLDKNKIIKYSKESDYHEHFMEIFRNAVKSRLVMNGENSIMMSGGLDSTSVFALAKEIQKEQIDMNINVVSGIFNRLRDCDEREFTDPLVKEYKTKPNYEVCDDFGVFDNFPDDSHWTFEPNVNAASTLFTKSLLERASDTGAINVLTGCASDHILGGSLGVIPDLLKKGKPWTAINQTYSFAKNTRESFLYHIWHTLFSPHFRKGWVTDFISIIPNTKLNDLSFTQMEFFNQLQGTKSRLFTDRELAPLANIDCKHPFLDKELVEFLFQIPGELCWDGGVTKKILRENMKPYLPNKIINRLNKTEHMSLTLLGVRKNWANLFEVVKEGRVSNYGFINHNDWINNLLRWRQGLEVKSNFWTLLTIEIWLYKYEKKLLRGKYKRKLAGNL